MKKIVRRGFTLPEILVTVTVIAVLAAVVVPTVLQYVSKGDGPSVLSEIDAIKKGMIGFTADTRHYPRTLQQLTAAISSTAPCSDPAGCDLSSIAYTSTEGALWKGPYFEGTVSSTAAATYATKALGVVFNTALVKCGAGSAFICLQVPIGAYTNATLDALDTKIDAGTGSTATDQVNGSLIWTSADAVAATVPTLIYFKLGVAN